MDGRYLFLGLLANLFGIVCILFNSTYDIIILFPYASMIMSGWFTVGGFMKKGSLNSITADGLLVGNFPIWAFGFWSIQLIQLSLYDYYRNLSICQDQLGQSLVSLIVCAGTQEALGLILLFGASLAFASAVTLACLLTLRRQSTRN